jgi:hypothetical protein
MQALREMVTAKGRDCSIQLPEWAVGQELEVIILPSSRQSKMKIETKGGSLIEYLLAHPLKVNGFSPMSRESIHER